MSLAPTNLFEKIVKSTTPSKIHKRVNYIKPTGRIHYPARGYTCRDTPATFNSRKPTSTSTTKGVLKLQDQSNPSNDPKQEYAEKLAKELAEREAIYQGRIQAVKEEFASQLTEMSAEDIRERFRKELVPDAFTRLHELILTAEKESVSANLIRFVFDTVLIEVPAGEEENELSKLIKELTKLDAS